MPAPHEDDYTPDPAFEDVNQPLYLLMVHEPRLNLAIGDMVPVRRRNRPGL